MENFTPSELAFILSCVNESFYNASQKLERTDLGDMDKRFTTERKELSHSLIIKLEAITDKM